MRSKSTKGKTKPSNKLRPFIEAMAYIYRETTLREPKRNYDAHLEQPTGLFFDFCDECLVLLNASVKPKAIDSAIRLVLGSQRNMA